MTRFRRVSGRSRGARAARAPLRRPDRQRHMCTVCSGWQYVLPPPASVVRSPRQLYGCVLLPHNPGVGSGAHANFM